MKGEKSEPLEGSATKNQDALLDENALPPNLIVNGSAAEYRSSSDDLDIEAPLIDDRAVSFASIADRVKARLQLPGSREEEVKPKRKRKRATKREQQELMEAARTILSPFLCFVVAHNLGEECAPTDEEADAFVEPFARIVARHVPIPEHLSPDLMDLFSMSAVAVIWYRRVQDNLPRRGDDGRRPSDRDDGRGPSDERVDVLGFDEVVPVEDASAVSEFLPRGDVT